ncbi:MAG: tyrosine--tRNA ligase [Deltaproteobacteria bacterium]|nr:tyrosine--tRNA ligase [Deltaproteobacteria bacterium]
MNVLDILEERGFIEAKTHDAEMRELFDRERVTGYIGFDPTASSLHIGSLVQIMMLAHMQRNGHQPIALVGGGTGLVGDPSGKTEMRKVLTMETIAENVAALKKQLSKFIDFSNDRALMLNNADWLVGLNYIHFLRDVGRYFSVNRMIKMESCKMRLDSEEGLSFLEFNYMILQAYDFLELFKTRNCKLQMGGSDQWGNIVSGIDLIHKMQRKQAYGITSPLITTSSGEKMGKTAGGAVWLDAERTTPYDYYQYWINVDDRDIQRFLALYTFLPMDEIRGIRHLKDAELNMAKAVLAFETTSLVHGSEEAVKAHRSAASVFGGRSIPRRILSSSSIPRDDAGLDGDTVPATALPRQDLVNGLPAFKVFQLTGLVNSGGAARRLIEQGGAYINNERVGAIDQMVSEKDLSDGEILLRSGKKKFHKIVARD